MSNAPEAAPPIYDEIAQLEQQITSSEDAEQLKAWRNEADAQREAFLGRRALPELGIDHAGNVMTKSDVAEMRQNGTDQDRTR